jgi:hypothetical protein
VNRRAFLAAVCALPGLRWLKCEPPERARRLPPVVWSHEDLAFNPAMACKACGGHGCATCDGPFVNSGLYAAPVTTIDRAELRVLAAQPRSLHPWETPARASSQPAQAIERLQPTGEVSRVHRLSRKSREKQA